MGHRSTRVLRGLVAGSLLAGSTVQAPVAAAQAGLPSGSIAPAPPPLPPSALRFDPAAIGATAGIPAPDVSRIRRVALFEGKDEFGRLQPF